MIKYKDGDSLTLDDYFVITLTAKFAVNEIVYDRLKMISFNLFIEEEGGIQYLDFGTYFQDDIFNRIVELRENLKPKLLNMEGIDFIMIIESFFQLITKLKSNNQIQEKFIGSEEKSAFYTEIINSKYHDKVFYDEYKTFSPHFTLRKFNFKLENLVEDVANLTQFIEFSHKTFLEKKTKFMFHFFNHIFYN